jgi:hypothetical protein
VWHDSSFLNRNNQEESAMSKASHRLAREARKEHKEKRRAAQRRLRDEHTASGLRQPMQSVSNRLCPYRSEAEEQGARAEAVEGQLGVFRRLLPTLIKDLSKIPDPRQPKKSKHKLTALLLYGLLSFVFQTGSRREANRTLSRPAFLKTLRSLFPELETLPHADTLHRVRTRLEIEELERAHVNVLRRLIRNKKFRRYLIDRSYPMAVDGSQKLVREGQWRDERWLERRRENAEGEDAVRQYVYVLEANLVLHNGVTVPLLSEFLSYAEGDPDDKKQDYELKAFYRLAKRLKAYFPRLPVLLLLDGLYPNGPLMAQSRRYGWQFMIVLPEKCLSSVREEVHALKPRPGHQRQNRCWQGRQQHFWWVNDIDYDYGRGQKHRLRLHVVGCEESWQEVDPNSGEILDKHAHHVWLSSEPLNRRNVHERAAIIT